MIDILMPALSPTMEDGTLAKWHVKPGDKVEPGQIIAEIQTDKATMEVEAADGGIVDALLIEEGTEGVRVNSPIARLGGESAQETPSRAPAPKLTPTPVPLPTPSPPPAAAAPASNISAAAAAVSTVKATPLARRIALSASLDLTDVRGSGPNGRILKRDVEQELGLQPRAAFAPAPAATVTAAATRPNLEAPSAESGSYDLVPLDGMRRTLARRMSESFRDVPHFPLTVDIEIDAFLALREQVNKALAKEGGKASLNDMIVKAAAVALQRVPDVNTSYTSEGIAWHRHADIAVAVAIEGGGLITPIVRRAEAKGLGAIAREIKDLAERARQRKLKPDEFQGGTFSISNLGMFGVRSFSSIINGPQGAILSVGAGEKRPVVRGEVLDIATVMTVTLTCDHRAMGGAAAAEWVKTFKSLIEDPVGLVL